MPAYRLYVVDEKGRSVNTIRPDHSRNGKPCLNFPDDKPFTIVLEHESMVTYIPWDGDGNMLDIEQEEPQQKPADFNWPAPKKQKRHRGRKQTSRR